MWYAGSMKIPLTYLVLVGLTFYAGKVIPGFDDLYLKPLMALSAGTYFAILGWIIWSKKDGVSEILIEDGYKLEPAPTIPIQAPTMTYKEYFPGALEKLSDEVTAYAKSQVEENDQYNDLDGFINEDFKRVNIQVIQPKKRGRPKGSKNKPKISGYPMRLQRD